MGLNLFGPVYSCVLQGSGAYKIMYGRLALSFYFFQTFYIGFTEILSNLDYTAYHFCCGFFQFIPVNLHDDTVSSTK